MGVSIAPDMGLSITNDGLSVQLGKGLDFVNGGISVQLGTNLEFDGNKISVTGSAAGVSTITSGDGILTSASSGNVGVSVNGGQGICVSTAGVSVLLEDNRGLILHFEN